MLVRWRNCVKQGYTVFQTNSQSLQFNVRALSWSPFVNGISYNSVPSKSQSYSPEFCLPGLASCRFLSSSWDANDSDKTPSTPASATGLPAESAASTTVDSTSSVSAGPQGKGGAKASSATDKPSVQTVSKNKVNEIVVKVQLTGKARQKTDFSQIYTANIYIPLLRAMSEYILESSDLDSLPKYLRRSPYPERDNITVFKRRDVEQKAIEKWGSLDNVQLQKELAEERRKESHAKKFLVRQAEKEYQQQHSDGKQEKPYISNNTAESSKAKISLFQHGSGRVVLYAIAINAANCVMKFVAWLYTGSHSMFAEFIHSLADTCNQLILAAGIRQSLKQPDTEHPYGWVSFRNVSSLISGVGIFCVGAGLSFYHGIMGLIEPSAHVESLYWALATLGGSFLSEGATLLVAINEVRQSCRKENMSFLQYVYRGRDPSTNVVLLEDFGAVVGLSIAATCISITHFTGNPTADAVGSLLIGTLLGGVASFIIYTNTQALVGRSIPLDKKMQMMRELESDRMIRTIHDVKATDVGGRHVRFKAEVDFDGREIARFYLEQQDLEKMLQEMQQMTTVEDVESFMLKHGECIVDTLGGEVDRIEKNLKKKHPEIRHCDLEQL